MAFDFNLLSRSGGTSPGAITFTYLTPDNKADILSTGYFTSAFTTVRADDLIVVVTQGPAFTVRVTGSTSLAVTVREDLTVAREFPITAFGDLRTAQLHPQFQGSLEYTVTNTELNSIVVVNGGTITQANAMAVVGSSTTTASTARFESKRQARYKPGLGGLIEFTALFVRNVADTEQYAGILDETGSSEAFKNGLAIGYDGAVFGFHSFANDVKFTVNQSSWDDPLDGTGASGMTLDNTKINVWGIRYQYLGAGAIQLLVQNDTTGLFVVVHTILYANKNTQPSSFNPNYRFTMFVDNKGTTTDLIIKCSSYAYFVEGKTKFIELQQHLQSSGEKQKTTVTTEVAILTIRNKSTYAGKTNFIDVVMQAITGSIEANSANNLGNIRLVRDATLGGTPSYSDINTSNSVIEIDTSGTTVTGGTEIFPLALAGKNDRDFVDLTNFELLLHPGETLTLTGASANSATIHGSLLWKELF